MQDVEILVHTTAPSRGPDDAGYRALAQAYLQFVPARRQPLEIVGEVVSKTVDHQSEKNSQESQKQKQQETGSWESYRPSTADDHDDHVSEQLATNSTQETTQGCFAYLRSFGSGHLSFKSVDDNRASPFYQTRSTKRKKLAEESKKLFQSPTKSIPDSQPQAEEGRGNERGLFSSPTKVLELYLQQIDSSQDSPESYKSRRPEDPEVTPTRPERNNDYLNSSFGSSPPINISRALFRPRAPSPILGDPMPTPTSSSEKNIASGSANQPTSSGNRQSRGVVPDPIDDTKITSSTPSNSSNEWVTWSPTERLRARQLATAKEISTIEANTPKGLWEHSSPWRIEEATHVSIGMLPEGATSSSSSDMARSRILETVPPKTIEKSLLREKDVPSASRSTFRLQVEESTTPVLARKVREMTRKALWNTPATSGSRIKETQLSVLRQPGPPISTSPLSPKDRIPETPYLGLPSSRKEYPRMDPGNEQTPSAISSNAPEEHVHQSKRPRTDSAKEQETVVDIDLPISSAGSTRETKQPRGLASTNEVKPPLDNASSPVIASTRQNLMEAELESATTSGARNLGKDKVSLPSISSPDILASSKVVGNETSTAMFSSPPCGQQKTTPVDKKTIADSAFAMISETPELPQKKFLGFADLPDEPEPTSSMPDSFGGDEEELLSSSDQPPSSSPVVPQVDHLLRIRPTPVMESYLAVDWLSPPHPPIGTDPIDPETFITPMFHKIAKNFPIDKLYHPATQSRVIEPLGRGYWRVDCSSWDQSLKEATWNTMGKLIAPGLLGWGVSCSRYSFENEGGKFSNGWDVFKCHCWGIQVPYVYCMIFMASQNKVAWVKSEWMVIRTNVVVTMPIEKKT